MRSDVIEVIARHDEAIDLHKSRIAEYTLTRVLTDDQGPLLVFVPGRTPVRYYVRRIPRSLLLRYVERGIDERDRTVRAFLVGVERIVGIEDEHGNRIDLAPQHEVETPAGPIAIFQEKDLEHVPAWDIYDIGAVAYTRGFLRPGRRGYFPPPPTAQSALENRVFLDAEWNRTLQDVISEQRKAARVDSDPRPSAPGSDGGEHTDATATGNPIGTDHPSPTQESEET